MPAPRTTRRRRDQTVIRNACFAVIIASALMSGGASATGTVGETLTEAYEERAEAEHRKSWCRWRWVRENMLARTLAGAVLEPCPPPSEEEMRQWRAEREERQNRGSS